MAHETNVPSDIQSALFAKPTLKRPDRARLKGETRGALPLTSGSTSSGKQPATSIVSSKVTGRPCGADADQERAGDQSQNGQGAWPHVPSTLLARAGGKADIAPATQNVRL